MAQFYAKKIGTEINPRTNELWTLNDVPVLWKEKVKLLLSK